MSHCCDCCKKKGATLRCASCKRVYYCNKKCQRAHWKSGHKQQCTQKYLQSSINNHAKETNQKITEITDISESCLPSNLFNRNKFIKFCNDINKDIVQDMAILIYCYLTSYQTTFNINNKQIEFYHFDYFKTLLRHRIDHIDNYQQWVLSLKSNKQCLYPFNGKRFQSSDWIKMREYGISILRDSADDVFGDAVDINIQICPPDGMSNSHCMAQFRATDIMETMNGDEIAQLIELILSYYHIPYQRFKSIGLSHSVTNNKQIRCDLLNTLQSRVWENIIPSFDYWKGEIAMKYENVIEYEAAQRMEKLEEECKMM